MVTPAPTWVRYGSRHGWMWRGAVPAKEMLGASFWTRAARVTCAAEGGCVDMVQCYDGGVFTAGPIGATARSGALAALVAEVSPEVRLKYLGALAEAHGLGLRESGTPAFTVGLRSAKEEDLRRVFLGGGDPEAWLETDEPALVARAWTVAFAEMLQDPGTRRAVGVAAARTVARYLSPEVRGLFGFVASAPEPPTPALRRACACYLSLAVNHPRGAEFVLRAAGPDADRILDVAGQPGAWPVTFSQRVGRTRAALAAEVW